MVIISDRSHQVNISFTLSAPTHPSRGYAWERRHPACNSDSSQSSPGSAGILPATQIPPNHLLGAQASCLQFSADSSQSSSGSAGILPAIQIPPNHLLGAQASCLQFRFLPIISWERRHPACNSVQILSNHLPEAISAFTYSFRRFAIRVDFQAQASFILDIA